MFAKELIELLNSGVVIFSMDESTISSTTSRTMSYDIRGGSGSRRFRDKFKNVHLFICAGSDGSLYTAFMTGTNNSATFSHY